MNQVLELIPAKKTIVGVLLGALTIQAAEFAYLGVKYIIDKRKQKEPVRTQEVFFFTESGAQCLSLNPHNSAKCQVPHCTRNQVRKIIAILMSATTSVDLCMYLLTHRKISDAIVKLIEKGVVVRFVGDENHGDSDGSRLELLRAKGAFVTIRGSKPFKSSPSFIVAQLHMHHKFAIIDKRVLLNGSMNWTQQAINGNYEHIYTSTDAALVQRFQEEFDLLYQSARDDVLEGINDTYVIPEKKLDWRSSPDFQHVVFFRRAGLECRTHMNRRIPCDRKLCPYRDFRFLMEMVEGASSTLDICLQQMTLDDLGNSIVQIHNQGVKVRFICDLQMATGTGSQVQKLIDAGVETRTRRGAYNMHHKFMIVDKKLVLCGSLNWTMQSLCGNYENVVVSCQTDFVDQFNTHFDYLWNEFVPFEEVFFS